MNRHGIQAWLTGGSSHSGENNTTSMASESLGETSGHMPGDLPGILDEGVSECERYNGGNELTGSLRLREIRDKHPEGYEILERELSSLVGKYVRGILRQNIPLTKRYVSDVIPVPVPEQRGRVRRWLASKGSTYPGGLYLWVDEGDHFHVIHDCAYSNGSCRCAWSQEAIIRRNVRRPLRRTKWISELDAIDWYNIFLYFALQKWQTRPEIWIGGTLQRSPNYSEGLQWFDLFSKLRAILGGRGGR